MTAPQELLTRRMAVVTAVNNTTPPTVTIQVGADTTTSYVAAYLSSYWPVVGDYVVDLAVQGDHFVLGRPEWSTTASGRLLIQTAVTAQVYGTSTGTYLKDVYCADMGFVALPGHLYRVKYTSRAISDTAGLTMDIYIKDSGSIASPTGASPTVAGASQYLALAGGPGATTVTAEAVLDSLTPGVHVIAAFYRKTAGPAGGVTTDQTNGAVRQLILEDVTE